MPNIPTSHAQALTAYNTRRRDGRTYKVLSPTQRIQPANPNADPATTPLTLHLYNTDVVTYNPDGTYTLAAEYWYTTITSRNINAALCTTPVRVGSNYHKPNPYGEPQYVLYGTPHTLTWSLPARKCRCCRGHGKGRVERQTTYHGPYDGYPRHWVERHMVYVPTDYACHRCNGTGTYTPTVNAYPVFIDGITINHDGEILTPFIYDRTPPANAIAAA